MPTPTDTEQSDKLARFLAEHTIAIDLAVSALKRHDVIGMTGQLQRASCVADEINALLSEQAGSV